MGHCEDGEALTSLLRVAPALSPSFAQGLTDFEKWPYVRLRLRDTPVSRSMWDHAFELEYEVTLGERHVIMRLAVRNTGDSDFAFTTALNSCIAVHDIRFPQRAFYKVRTRAGCRGCCSPPRSAREPHTHTHTHQGVAGSYCVDKLAEERRVKKENQDLHSITCVKQRHRSACSCGDTATLAGDLLTRCTWTPSLAWLWRLARAARCTWRTPRASLTTSFGTRGPRTRTTQTSCVWAAVLSDDPSGLLRCVLGDKWQLAAPDTARA